MSKLIVSADGGAIPAESLNTRRGFLRGVATLLLIGGAVTLIGRPTAVAEPFSPRVLERYIACPERFAADWEYARRCTPLQWFPDAHDIERLVTATKPSTRAAAMLSAVGCEWRVPNV